MKQRMKILIGYDGSSCAEAALDDLRRAGLPSEAEAVLMSVTDVFLPPPPPSSCEVLEQARALHSHANINWAYPRGSLAIQEAQSVAERGGVRLRANFPGWEITAEASIGNDPLTPTLIGRFIPPVAKIIEESNQADREWLKKTLENSSERLRLSGLEVLIEIREGDPKRVLVEAAEEWGADCIFVGSIGFGNPFERFVLGSVAASVAARAHCSVEIVRPPKTNGGNHDERKSEQFRG